MVKHWTWDDNVKELTIFCRESQTAIYGWEFDNFADAKECADAFMELYDQGVRHGKQLALEEIRRTVDHIDRSI